MTAIAEATQPSPSRVLIWLLAIGAGIGVANVYYVQPIVPEIGASLHLSERQASFLPAISQIGYAAGMLLLAPLGDVVDRKRLIIVKSVLLVVTLAVIAAAPNLLVFGLASLTVGALGSLGQDFVPTAAYLANDDRRGATIGLVMTGLLAGILLSRTLGGAASDWLGWRAVYAIAALLVAAVAVGVAGTLPQQPPTVKASYRVLLASLVKLLRTHALVRKALLTQALLAATLGGFWSTLALMLAAPPFHLGASSAGAFGLAGAAGALGAPLVGRYGDSHGPTRAIVLGSGLVVIAFLLMLVVPHSLVAITVGAILFDLGVTSALVSHQTMLAALDPTTRSRLNSLLMTVAMIGVSSGALVGGWAWNGFGWPGVCLASIGAGLLALLRAVLPPMPSATAKENN